MAALNYLRLNGVIVPVPPGGLSIVDDEIGVVEYRALSGASRRARKALKRRWEVQTTPMRQADADALRNLVLGRGYHYPFDNDLYSEGTMFTPNSGYAAGFVIGSSSPSPKTGTGRLSVPSAGLLSYAHGLPTDNYCVMGWIDTTGAGAGTWEHWVRRVQNGTTTLWKNGVSGQAALHSFTVTSGTAQIQGKNPSTGANAAIYVDDFVVFPWAPTDTQIGRFYNFAIPFSAMPKLDAGGFFEQGLEDGPATGTTIEVECMNVKRETTEGFHDDARTDLVARSERIETTMARLSWTMLEC